MDYIPTTMAASNPSSRVYFEQQREALMGEIAMVMIKTATFQPRRMHAWHPVTAALLTMTIILTQNPYAELRAGPGKHQQAEPEPRGRHHGRQRVLVGRGAVEHL